jgi:hypothetical protein
MGYSARYHAASLAAVFLALAIGILIGVGLGDNVVKGAKEDLEQSLRSDLADARGQAEDLQGQLNREREFDQQAFPALVGGVLRGDRVGVIALGGLPDAMKGDIDAVIGDQSPTGGRLAEFAVVSEPPDVRSLAGEFPPQSKLRAAARNSDDLTALGHRAARSLVTGGALFDRIRDPLLARTSGEPGGIDGVIVVRQQPDDLPAGRADKTAALEDGVLSGLESTGVSVVGVERSDADSSSIGFFEAQDVPATVDSIDLASGRVALAYALAGVPGNYGIKSTADSLLPELGRPRVAAAIRTGGQ